MPNGSSIRRRVLSRRIASLPLSRFFLSFWSARHSHRWRMWTDFDDLCVLHVNPPKNVPFGGSVNIAPYLVGCISKKTIFGRK